MPRRPEKGNAPEVAATGASSVKTQDINQGFNVSNSIQVAASRAITPDLTVVDGHVTTTSNQIAAHFGKRHDTVLRAIANLDCSPEFTDRNFAASEYTDSTGRTLPSYRLTRDGFVFLAMGFTGKDAAQWKEAYITAFNKMEAELLARTHPTTPAIDYDRISPAQAQDLKELVHAIVDAKVQGFGETWARLHKKFRVNSYLELPAARFDEARDYLLGKLPEAAQPLSEAERIKQAFALAAEVAAVAQCTVFDALIDGRDASMHDRWMFTMTYDRDGKPTVPWAKPVESGAMVVSMADLPRRLLEPNGLLPSNKELADLAAACNQRLAQRMCHEASRVTTAKA